MDCCCLPRPGPSSSLLWFPFQGLNTRIDLTGSAIDLSSCGEAPQSVQMIMLMFVQLHLIGGHAITG